MVMVIIFFIDLLIYYIPPPSDGLLYGYGHPVGRNATTINNDHFEVEGKKWLDAM